MPHRIVPEFVVKVQRPIGIDFCNSQWLLYNENRSFGLHLDESQVPEELVKLMGNRYKIFVTAFLDEGEIHFGDPIEEKDGF